MRLHRMKEEHRLPMFLYLLLIKSNIMHLIILSDLYCAHYCYD